MFQFDTIIVGGGLFGQIIADALKAEGRSVYILDEAHEHAGSKPAACLMKPSWFSSLGPEVYEPSLKLLDELYGVHDLKFHVGKTVPATVHWCDPRKILRGENKLNRFLSASHDGQFWHCEVEHLSKEYSRQFSTLSSKNLIIAAGIWSNEVLEKVQGMDYRVKGLRPQYGVAFVYDGKLDKPFIQPWAPYRQLVGFNRAENEVWTGDGTALKELTEERIDESEARCWKAVKGGLSVAAGDSAYPCKLIGARPYVSKVKPALLEDLERGLFVVTGGAKNGTLAAGYCAHKIRELVL